MTKAIVQEQTKANKTFTIGKGKSKVTVTSEGNPYFDLFVTKISSIFVENKYELMQERLLKGRGR
ncbi:hypothetical protein [Peribacillus simplex]|uniref:hypothetical protein n=1 Tax=Peribacillus simplex TaxID=1478 RepID=UPI0024C1126A|nr:hypothetical protein [Peribacillus simplex]WHY58660.1 hypothetical protein QNH43_10570 [Peribacillus simplex]